MTVFTDELESISRQSQTIVIFNTDKCALTHGVAPCTATQTGNDKCYNTRGTCNDTPNYTLKDGGRDDKFSINGMLNPFPPQTIRPYLVEEPTYLSTKIDPKNSLTENARVTLKFMDELSNDSAGIDPYFEDRTYHPNAPGTFWRKWLARNEHYRGRTATIKQGFHGLSESDYVSRQYIIDQIKIDKQGIVTVILKDILKKADRSQIPAPTSGTVADDPLLIGASVLNYNIDDDKIGEYPEPSSEGNFLIRVDDELMWIDDNDRDNKQFSILERGVTIGSIVTVAEEHNVDSKIQMCYVAEDVNGVDIALEMIEDFIPLDSSLINTAGFQLERDQWLTSFIFTGVISQPMPVSQALSELMESMMSNLFWSEEIQLVEFKTFAPLNPSEIPTQVSWNDDDHLITIATKENEDSRVSQMIVHFNKKVLDDPDKDESYESFSPKKDSASESAEEFGEPAIENIRSRWIQSKAVASTLANRWVVRYTKPPRKLDIAVEIKDALLSSGTRTADIVKITTDMISDKNGFTAEDIQYEILEKAQKSKGTYSYTVMDTGFNRRVGFIQPAGVPDYDSASDNQKLWAFIGDANNNVGALIEQGYFIF